MFGETPFHKSINHGNLLFVKERFKYRNMVVYYLDILIKSPMFKVCKFNNLLKNDSDIVSLFFEPTAKKVLLLSFAWANWLCFIMRSLMILL